MTKQEINSIFADLFDLYAHEVASTAKLMGWTMEEAGLHFWDEKDFKADIEKDCGVKLLGPIGHMRVTSVCDIIHAKANNIPLQVLIKEKKEKRK